MIQTILRLVFHHWQRKLLSIVVACVLWLVVSHSMTTTRRLYLPVRVVNLAPDLSVDGLAADGFLEKTIALQVTGAQSVLDRLGPRDLEVVVDAGGHRTPWTEQITSPSVVATDSLVDLSRAIRDVMPAELAIDIVPKVRADIPVQVRPVGVLPDGYRLVDVWPNQLVQSLEGPEPCMEELRRDGLTLSLPISEIPVADLERLCSHVPGAVVHWRVPESWKQITLPPDEAEHPLTDPKAADMVLELVRGDGWILPQPVPIGILMEESQMPEISWGRGTALWGGRRVVSEPIQIQGCSHRFVEAVGPYLEWLVRLNEIGVPEMELTIRGRLQAQERFLELVRQDGGALDDSVYLEQFDREWRRLEAQRLDGSHLAIEVNHKNDTMELALCR
jgi:hypothetical protein